MERAGIQFSGGTEFLWQRIVSEAGGAAPGVNHALVVILSDRRDLCLDVATIPDPEATVREARAALSRSEAGADLEGSGVLDDAARRAAGRGSSRVFDRDLVAAVLVRAGFVVKPTEESATPVPGSAPLVGQATAAGTGQGGPAAGATQVKFRASRPTPQLEKLARDLTREAAEGLLPEVLGRDVETQTVIETLLRQSKRNPLLVGPAGVGKTAIVEGLAQRVVRGDVPEALRGVRVFALQVTDLVQGMRHVGDFEERMKLVLAEAEQDGIILFLDEIHAAVGAGSGSEGHNDLANILKPALARGRMACIGATTDNEYTRFLTADPAFERRFQPLRVQEPTRAATAGILLARGQATAKGLGIEVPQDAVETMVALADRFMRNRFMPDKAIDVFEQSVARARLHDEKRVTPELVREVVGAMVGMPVDGEALTRRLEGLRDILVRRGGCTPETADRISHRLQITMRGMDVHPLKPDAVILAVSDRQDPVVLARAIADGLFGDDAPLIETDMSTFLHPSDVNWLVGAPPGYVGHDQTLPLHLMLAQRPWSVVVFKRPDLAHEAVRAALAASLLDGFLKDPKGRRVHLSDAVVVLTAMVEGNGRRRSVGFETGACVARQERPQEFDPSAILGPELGRCVDLTCVVAGGTAVTADWVATGLLEPLARRWAEDCGVVVTWEHGVDDLVARRATGRGLDRGDAERMFEDEIVPVVVAAAAEAAQGARIVVRVRGDGVVANRVEGGPEDAPEGV